VDLALAPTPFLLIPVVGAAVLVAALAAGRVNETIRARLPLIVLLVLLSVGVCTVFAAVLVAPQVAP
jgi:hypothetical protein